MPVKFRCPACQEEHVSHAMQTPDKQTFDNLKRSGNRYVEQCPKKMVNVTHDDSALVWMAEDKRSRHMKFDGREFSNETINLDGNEFSNCRFEACELVFRGQQPVTLDGCSFGSAVKWVFADSAGLTLAFLSGIYRGAGNGGKELIESTFQAVRTGAFPLHVQQG